MISHYCQIIYRCPLPSSTSPRDFWRIWCLLSVLSFSSSSSFSWMAMLRTLARASSYNQTNNLSYHPSWLQRKITFIFFVLADALFLWDLTVYTHPFSLCSSKLLYEISEGHSDCLWVYVESVNFSSPVKPDRWCTARHAVRATTSLRGTSPGDGASTTLSGGGICVLKSYTNNAKKIKSPFSNYSMSCLSEFKISNLKKLRPVLDHKT